MAPSSSSRSRNSSSSRRKTLGLGVAVMACVVLFVTIETDFRIGTWDEAVYENDFRNITSSSSSSFSNSVKTKSSVGASTITTFATTTTKQPTTSSTTPRPTDNSPIVRTTTTTMPTHSSSTPTTTTTPTTRTPLSSSSSNELPPGSIADTTLPTTATPSYVQLVALEEDEEQHQQVSQHHHHHHPSTRLDRNIAICQAAKAARRQGIGNCGGTMPHKSSNTHNDTTSIAITSLEQTSQRFAQFPPMLLHDDDNNNDGVFSTTSNDDDDDDDNSSAWILRHRRRRPSPQPRHRQVLLLFQAYDRTGFPRITGGDEFMVTFFATGTTTRSSSRSRSSSSTSTATTTHWKMATASIDLLNGTYAAIVKIPSSMLLLQKSATTTATSAAAAAEEEKGEARAEQKSVVLVVVDTFHLTLHHYYTCHQGFLERYFSETTTTNQYKKNVVFYPLETAGPSFVTPHEEFTQLVQSKTKNKTYVVTSNDADDNSNNNNRDDDAEEEEDADEEEENKDNIPKEDEVLLYCEASQAGINALTDGLWVEPEEEDDDDDTSSFVVKRPPLVNILNETNTRMTLRAQWEPTTCLRRPQVHQYLAQNVSSILRIGDSTMPYPTLQVGDVYRYRHEFAGKWIRFLEEKLIHATLWLETKDEKKETEEWSSAAAKETAENVLFFTGGLHQLLGGGYNAKSTVSLVTRMMCQLAAVTPGYKLQWLGPVPIQQQLYPLRDITDQNVQWVNAMLRQQITTTTTNSSGGGGGGGGSLTSLCLKNTAKVNLTTFVTVADDHGDIVVPYKNPTDNDNDAKTNYENSPLHTEPSSKLLEAFTSKRYLEMVYGDRQVYFCDIQDFLRARPETYLVHDKIHDKRAMEGGDTLFLSEHDAMIQQLIQLRAMSKDS
jgi:hypothetical protein